MTTPTDSAEKVVAELRARIGSEFDGELHLSEDEAISLFALIESQRATIERVERELEAQDAEIVLTDSLLADERHARLAAEARVTALEAEKAEKDAALAPLARLEIPKKPVGNAGAYSIRHDDILRARQALSRSSTEVKNDGTL